MYFSILGGGGGIGSREFFLKKARRRDELIFIGALFEEVDALSRVKPCPLGVPHNSVARRATQGVTLGKSQPIQCREPPLLQPVSTISVCVVRFEVVRPEKAPGWEHKNVPFRAQHCDGHYL